MINYQHPRTHVRITIQQRSNSEPLRNGRYGTVTTAIAAATAYTPVNLNHTAEAAVTGGGNYHNRYPLFKTLRALTQHREKKNDKGKTPTQIFTETHKDLIKDGEQWLKDTANASTIVATLIVTVVFAAAITVPGGNNGDGYPGFYKRASFLIFGISDAFALFSSTTSVPLFLSILTSRCGENDFLVIISRRLIFGLITLFLSILSTIIAFGATLYLVFGDSYKTWIIFPMLVLPSIPAILFMELQFPLLVDMYKSTYCTIFVKQDANMLY
ncbi:hypothetical protein HYC85_000268 [Camellia sinensis]|uniref:PGG domain-containing protein n=1 Tax=Camellia sinensis TaxID=4442 RepID=A0A7J7I297_CAMSI|nr:hypothetical protein HYC85_000268 [Camellia sinensis]